MNVKLSFDTEHLDNGYLVNVNYQAAAFKDTYYKRFFFNTLDEVKACYAEQIGQLA